VLPTYSEAITQRREERRRKKEMEKIITHVVNAADSWLSIAIQYNVKVSVCFVPLFLNKKRWT
jgi:hypothetical protein